MRSLQQRLADIEREIHTLETATPRNSATVDRGGLSVVDEGSVILESGGTIFFEEGGSATSEDYSLEDGVGWQVGTERRGSSIVVLNDAPGLDLEVTTANSQAVYEEIVVEPETETDISLGSSSMLMVQLFHMSKVRGSIQINGADVWPTEVIRSRVSQWTYSHLETTHDAVKITTDMDEVTVRLVRFTVNNVS